MKKLNLVDTVFGSLIVLRPDTLRPHTHWLCHCECENLTTVSTRNLRSGMTKSCGCLRQKPQGTDLSGRRFNRLLVINRSKTVNRRSYWRCKCDCGNCCTVMGKLLRNDMTKSCGCLQTEHAKTMRLILPTGRSALNQLYANYKRQAMLRNLEFLLDISEFEILTKKICFYCGEEPSQIHPKVKRQHNGHYVYNGIDRKDSSVGYVLSNCVPCCGTCNFMKKQSSVERFLEICAKIVEYQKNKGEILTPPL